MAERRISNGFPDKGPLHAVLMALFDGKKNGRVVNNEQLKTAVAREYGDNLVLISDGVVRVTVSSPRKIFKRFAPEYKIRNRRNIGYYIVNESETKK